MSDKNDFWNSSSNDDFWSKPVVSDDWLKSDSKSMWNDSKENDDFWNTSLNSYGKQEESEAYESAYEIKEEPVKETVSQTADTQFADINGNPYISNNPYTSNNPYAGNHPYEQRRKSYDDAYESGYNNSGASSQSSYDNSWYVNPYENKKGKQADTTYKTQKKTKWNDSARENKHQSAAQVYAQVTGQEPAKKKKHVHTIICLSFLLLAMISWGVAVAKASIVEKEAKQAIMEVDYDEVIMENHFTFGTNNEVFMEDVAYTIVSEESFMGFPAGQKLIAVYVKVESEDYESDGYAFRDLYVGYEAGIDGAEDVMLYKMAADQSMVLPFVQNIGFANEHILSTYGIGNGLDYEGYFFFFLPADVETFTLYAEQKKDYKSIRVLDKIYYKEMTVLPESDEITKELTKRGTD